MRMPMMKSPPTKLCLKPRASVCLVFAIIWGVVFVIVWDALTQKGAPSWLPISMYLFVTGVTFLHLLSYKLEVLNGGIRLHTLFRGSMSLDDSEIDTMEYEVGKKRLQDGIRPYYRLIINPSATIEKAPIIVNLKLFSRNDLAKLYRCVCEFNEKKISIVNS